MTMADLRAYRALTRAPIHSDYKGYDVYGMPVPSSGGIAVAEILNLIQAYEDRTGVETSELSDVDYLHRFSEASATAFADRNRYVGDVPGVPVQELISPAFAAERACLFDPTKAQPRPIPFGSPDGSYTSCAPGTETQREPHEGPSTTHLTAADRWGNVASYTLTIESTGGSAITVPGYGFLLNNELTDFNFVPTDPGRGHRPEPARPGQAAALVDEPDDPARRRQAVPRAGLTRRRHHHHVGVADDPRLPRPRPAARRRGRGSPPQLAQRRTEGAEPALLNSSVGAGLTALGHRLSNAGEIGAVTAIRSLDGGGFEAAAETVRRGGGSAMVVKPQR